MEIIRHQVVRDGSVVVEKLVTKVHPHHIASVRRASKHLIDLRELAALKIDLRAAEFSAEFEDRPADGDSSSASWWPPKD
jgi:hypothetical protein